MVNVAIDQIPDFIEPTDNLHDHLLVALIIFDIDWAYYTTTPSSDEPSSDK